MRVASKELKFDISYLTSRDNVAFTATYKSHFLLDRNSLSIKLSDNEELEFPLELLYIDKDREDVIHRIRFEVPMEIFKKMYKGNSSYKITIANEKYAFFYEYPVINWIMKRQNMNPIIRIMELYD